MTIGQFIAIVIIAAVATYLLNSFRGPRRPGSGRFQPPNRPIQNQPGSPPPQLSPLPASQEPPEPSEEPDSSG